MLGREVREFRRELNDDLQPGVNRLVLFGVAIMALVQFSDPATLVSLLVALAAVQFVIGNFLDPYVMAIR